MENVFEILEALVLIPAFTAAIYYPLIWLFPPLPPKPKRKKADKPLSLRGGGDNGLATGLVDVMITDMWVNH